MTAQHHSIWRIIWWLILRLQQYVQEIAAPKVLAQHRATASALLVFMAMIVRSVLRTWKLEKASTTILLSKNTYTLGFQRLH